MRWGSRKETGGCRAFLLSDNQYWDWLLERMDEQELQTICQACSILQNSEKALEMQPNMQWPRIFHSKSHPQLFVWAHPITVCEVLFDRQDMWWMLSHNKRLQGWLLNSLILIQTGLNRRLGCYLNYLDWADSVGSHFKYLNPQERREDIKPQLIEDVQKYSFSNTRQSRRSISAYCLLIKRQKNLRFLQVSGWGSGFYSRCQSDVWMSRWLPGTMYDWGLIS